MKKYQRDINTLSKDLEVIVKPVILVMGSGLLGLGVDLVLGGDGKIGLSAGAICGSTGHLTRNYIDDFSHNLSNELAKRYGQRKNNQNY